jgi:hypothetical protein
VKVADKYTFSVRGLIPVVTGTEMIVATQSNTAAATRDFQIGKRLTNLPALREVGFSANRRLLGVQQLRHDEART